MNNIYDFNEIYDAQEKQKKLIFQYVISAICFVVILVLACALIKNSALLTAIFSLVLLAFILFSVVFWKIKYGILQEYKVFLDNLETGKREDYVGIFKRKIEKDDDDEQFVGYVFASSTKETCFLIHKKQKMSFDEGKKYHVACVGNYICQWEILE